MTRSALAIAIAAILAGSAAVAQQTTTPPDRGVTGTTSGDSRSSNPNRVKEESTNTEAPRNWAAKETANKPDEKFLKDFAQANASEVEAGKLAATKAQHPEVKAFAKHMVDDHSKAVDKVQTIASQSNVDVKEKPDAMQKSKTAMLDTKSGADFDKAYIKAQVDDHQKVVDMLQKEIKEGQDASVKKLASDALPDVQKHLKTAQDLQAKLSTSSAKTSMRKEPNSTERTAAD